MTIMYDKGGNRLTKQMVEDLLHAITNVMEELEDVKTNSRQIDQLYTNLESRIDHMGLHIDGLEKNMKCIDRKIAVVTEGRLESGTKKLIARKVVY